MTENTELQVVEDRQMVSDFNPNDHIIQIPSSKGKTDYLPVQWRLVWFRLLCPQGTIDTEELEVDLDRECEAEISAWNQETRRSEKVIKIAKGYARYRAVVTDGKGGRASATKTERKVDFDDFVEKAETGAVGRALAMLGYGTQFAMIEFDEGERVVDSPVARPPAKSYQERRPFVEADKPKDQALHNLGKPGSYEEHHEAQITDQQKASIRKLYEHLGEEVVEGLAAMTYQQAKDAIVELSARYNQMKGRTPAPVVEAPQPQTTNHHDLPTIRELQDRCTRVIGSGMWQTWLRRALKIGDDELVLQDDDLTPGDRERIAASLDYAEEQKKKAKVSAGAGK